MCDRERPVGAGSIELVGLGRTFGTHAALDGVTVDIRPGEIHALIGENGAGKSTLGKILSGSMAPSSGRIVIDGEPVVFRHPADALHHGIATMHQEISLAPHRSVLDNVMLGREARRLGFVNSRANLRRFEQLAELTGFDLDPYAVAGSLTLAAQQEVEVLRALARDARLIVMDEPTAALPGPAAKKLHGVVRALRERGTSVVYISHFLEEIIELSDRITVLRNGRLVVTQSADDLTVDALVRQMLGRDLEASYPTIPPVPEDAPITLRAAGVRSDPLGPGVDLAVRAGEVVGIFGLVGSGRSELAMTLFGASQGTVEVLEVAGRAARHRKPKDAMRSGLMLLPESRKEEGLFLGRSQEFNVSVTATEQVSTLGFVDRRKERRLVQRQLEEMGVDPVDPGGRVGVLSGGNQQKVLFGKCLVRHPEVLLLDEPTRGVDVGSRRAIYDRIATAVAGGMALVVISSEIDEVVNLSHRVLVMREGAIVAEFAAENATHDAVLSAAFGLNPMAASSPSVVPTTSQESA